VHRDLKLENVLLSADYKIKICDFGFSGPINGRQIGDDYLTTKLGTYRYMAPEIFRTKRYDGAKVDVFSCGIMLFIMVTGDYPPFDTAKLDDVKYAEFCN
jgi:serine/threonine protein kinase